MSPQAPMHDTFGRAPLRQEPKKLTKSWAPVIIMLACFVALVGTIMIAIAMETGVTQSTVSRNALHRGEGQDSNPRFVSDMRGGMSGIQNAVRINRALDDFVRKTGVRPFIYLTSHVYGTDRPTASDMRNFANEVFRTYNLDETHVVILFQERAERSGHMEYMIEIFTGFRAINVMDSESVEILLDYLEIGWNTHSTWEQIFEYALGRTANRIMSRSISPGLAISLCWMITLVVAIVGCVIAGKARAKKEQALIDQKILETPLEHL
jgi:hypothetical protein